MLARVRAVAVNRLDFDELQPGSALGQLAVGQLAVNDFVGKIVLKMVPE